MTPPQRAVPRSTQKPATPADRSAELMETQRRLKREAAERRLDAADEAPPAKGLAAGKTRKRG